MAKEKQPNIIKQYDKRSGITYFYESIYYWDSEKQQSRTKRKFIGKLDPTDGRMKKKKTDVTPMSSLTEIKRRFYGYLCVGSISEGNGVV